jgi:heterodisulfide reductase subunit A
MMSKEMILPRAGVFVCYCGTNVGGVVDVPSVVEYSKTLPGVVYADASVYACSSDSLNRMKKAIQEHKLDRVVVAACTPRTYEPLFQSAIEEAGLNKYMLEMANIREQCSWVHMDKPEAATEKAKTLVGMAVAKVGLLKPQEEPEAGINPTALVIGGGIAGLTSALSLANQGLRVHLVEREAELGGLLRCLNKLFPLERDCSELLRSKIESVVSNPNIRLHTSSTIKSVKGFIGNFDVEIESRRGDVESLEAGTIIVATGATNFEPAGLYGYGSDERIITQLQLEERLKNDGLEGIGTVVIIQCVGSRDKKRPYCSGICCTAAIKNALHLKESEAGRDVFILYRDLQSYGLQRSSLEWRAKKQGVKLMRYLPENPPKVIPKKDAIVVNFFSPLLNETIDLEADLLVLSTPMMPATGTNELAQMLKVPLDSNGFYKEANVGLSPIEFATDGVYVCGMAHSPKDVGESILQALGVASRAAIPMARGRLRTSAITAEVDERKCSGCGTCAELCPYKAIRKDEKGIARVIRVLCKGCGLCGASCPDGAITIPNYTNEQLEAQCSAALGRVDN